MISQHNIEEDDVGFFEQVNEGKPPSSEVLESKDAEIEHKGGALSDNNPTLTSIEKLPAETWFTQWLSGTETYYLGGEMFHPQEGWGDLSPNQLAVITFASQHVDPKGVAYIDLENEREEAIAASQIEVAEATKSLATHRNAPSPAATLMSAAAGFLRAGAGLVSNIGSVLPNGRKTEFNEQDLIASWGGNSRIKHDRLKAMLIQSTSLFGSDDAAVWHLSSNWLDKLNIDNDEREAKLVDFTLKGLPKTIQESLLSPDVSPNSTTIKALMSSLRDLILGIRQAKNDGAVDPEQSSDI